MDLKNLSLITICLLVLPVYGCNITDIQDNKRYRNDYRYTVNLAELSNDQIKIELITPGIDLDSLEFVFAVSELAYYNNDLNHGKLISNLKVYDSSNQPLEIDRIADNRWVIYESKRMTRIEYTVDDIWEVRDSLSRWLSSENIFDKGNVIQFSPNATFGYFDGYEQRAFEVILKNPKDIYLSSGLSSIGTSTQIDTVYASNFMELSDYPMLFTNQKPVEFKVSNSIIEVGVYSDSSKVKAQWVANQIKPMIEAISEYFDGELPAEKYAFLIYFYPGPIFAATASEHNTSSVWVQPLNWDESILGGSMSSQIQNTAIHEFLHIYAPLNIHSEEKLNFDFDNPEMSKHLWLYEGTTTYMQELIKMHQNWVTEEYFINYINSTLAEMQAYRTDVSLTEISKQTYGEELGDEYDNVELKGVLANMILDIKLREKSNGTYGMKNLILDLCEKFGRNRSFKDDDFFEIISETANSPELVDFLNYYIGGVEPLPLKEVFDKVGYQYIHNTNTIIKMDKLTVEQENLKKAWLSHK